MNQVSRSNLLNLFLVHRQITEYTKTRKQLEIMKLHGLVVLAACLASYTQNLQKKEENSVSLISMLFRSFQVFRSIGRSISDFYALLSVCFYIFKYLSLWHAARRVTHSKMRSTKNKKFMKGLGQKAKK